MTLDLNDLWRRNLARHNKPLVTKRTIAGFGGLAVLLLIVNLALLGAAIWVVVMVLRWTGVIQ